MLFNSPIFMFVFLPITLLGFFTLSKRAGHREAAAWLVLASLVYYGYWNPVYLILIAASIFFNYALGSYLAGAKPGARTGLIFGIVANLATIGYFKYANFFVDNVNALTGTEYALGAIALPLAISFFTFQQIAFLVDAYRGETREYDFLNYCLFVTFFPQLIAGPIVHHKEMMPQFAEHERSQLNWDNVARGLTMFVIGLFKKVAIADTAAIYATRIFERAEIASHENPLGFWEAWGGALAYTFQLYFDFSGYSDMAIGLAFMIGIQLPLNFNSPYKARNIIDFWRRWHMTLSRFLRDYLYIPLGGNRYGKSRRYINLSVTMLLGGLWHGAPWNFVLWGGLHGLYLVINHMWRRVVSEPPKDAGVRMLYDIASLLLTFIAAVMAWVLFRALTLAGAGRVYAGMLGANGIRVPESWYGVLNTAFGFGDTLRQFGIEFSGTVGFESALQIAFLAGLALLAFTAPNVSELFQLFDAAPSRRWTWATFRPSRSWALYSSAMLATTVLLILSYRVSEFLYFEF